MVRAALLCLALAGCASQRTETVILNPAPNTCQATEVRASMLSTAVMGACWNEDGKMVNAQWVSGQPSASVPLAVLGAGASLGSAMILGSQIVKAAKAMPRDFSLDVGGDVSTTSTVDVSGNIGVNGAVDIGDGSITIDALFDDTQFGSGFSEWLEGELPELFDN